MGFQALRKKGAEAYAAVKKLLNHKNPYVAARAIWLLPHLGEKGKKEVVELLDSENSTYRLVAYRSLRRYGDKLLPYAKKMAKDPAPGVRRDTALSMRLPTSTSKPVLLEVAKNYDGYDKKVR